MIVIMVGLVIKFSFMMDGKEVRNFAQVDAFFHALGFLRQLACTAKSRVPLACRSRCGICGCVWCVLPDGRDDGDGPTCVCEGRRHGQGVGCQEMWAIVLRNGVDL